MGRERDGSDSTMSDDGGGAELQLDESGDVWSQMSAQQKEGARAAVEDGASVATNAENETDEERAGEDIEGSAEDATTQHDGEVSLSREDTAARQAETLLGRGMSKHSTASGTEEYSDDATSFASAIGNNDDDASFASAAGEESEKALADVSSMILEQRHTQLLAEVEDLKTQLEYATAKVEHVLSTTVPKKNYERCEEELQQTMSQLDKLQELQSEASALLGSLSAKNELNKDNIQILEESLARSQKESAGLTARIDHLLSEIDVLHASGQDQARMVAELEAALNSCRGEVEYLHTHCAQLNEALAQTTNSYEAEMAQLLAAVNMTSAERNLALSEVAYFRRLVERMQVDFALRTTSLDKQISAAAREKTELRVTLKNRERKLNDAELDAVNVRMELAKSRQYVSELRMRSAQQQSLISELETKLRAVAESVTKADARAREAERRAQKESAKAAAMKALYVEEADRRAQDTGALRKKLVAAEAEVDALRQDKEAMSAQIEKRAAHDDERMRAHQAAIEQMESELRTSRMETSALKVALAQTEARIVDLERVRRSSDLQPATQALISLEMERAELRKQRARSNADICAAEQRQNALFSSVERLRKQLCNVPVRSASRRRLEIGGRDSGPSARGMGSRSAPVERSKRPGARLVQMLSFGLIGSMNRPNAKTVKSHVKADTVLEKPATPKAIQFDS